MVQHIAFCLQGLIPACSPRFLHIVFQRVGNVIVDHQFHIGLVHSHAKGGCCHNYLYFVPDESFLVFLLLAAVHFPIEWPCLKAIAD